MSLTRNLLHVSIVGAGAVGTTLAVMLARKGHRIVSVVSRDVRDARRCARLTGCKRYSASVADLDARSDLIVIATPEKAIQGVVSSIARNPALSFPHLRVCHTSGVSTSVELESLRRRGCLTFSFHPIQTFPKGLSPHRQLKSMEGISYGVEGAPRALRFGRLLASELGGKMFVVPKEQKILYHLTCVVASNYTATLLGVVGDLARQIGGRGSFRHFANLIDTSVRNAIALTPEKALTGPIARGDGSIIKQHLQELRRDRNLKALYRELALRGIMLARRGKKLTRSQVKGLKRILADYG